MSTIGLWTDVLRSWVWYVGRRHLGILEPEGTIFGRGGGAIIVSLTINETIMCKMNILFYWRRLETNSCGNNLLKYKSSEMWVHFFLHRLPYIRLLFWNQVRCFLLDMQVKDTCALASLFRPSGYLFLQSIFTICDCGMAQISVWNFYLAPLLNNGHNGTSDNIRLMVHFER